MTNKQSRFWAPCLSLAMLLPMPAAVAQANLNLGSSTHTSVAPQAGVIREAGHTKVVQAGELVTAGELTALLQTLNSGHQTLTLNSQGSAIGGRFNVATDLQNVINSLAIPKNVTALDNAALGGVFDLTGSLTNAGRIYAYSSNLQSRQATLNVGSLFNEASGMISSLMPRSLDVRSVVPQLDLTLNSTGDFINKGVISSSGNLTIGANNITNSGAIQALKGNINFASAAPVNFTLDNTGGSITALKGDINLRDASYTYKNDATIIGGNFSAKAFNLFTGDGTLTVNVDKMIGRVNISAGVSHVNASTAQLDLGNIYLTGDPTFYNTGGDVVINGSIVTPGQNIAIVAGGDIISGTAGSIDTSVASGSAGSITLVAGAQFTSSAGSNTSTYDNTSHNFIGNSTDTITITNGSVIGGRIDLTQGTGVTSVNTSSGNGNAGNINMVAFGGTNTGSGNILLPSNGSVTANATNGQAGLINVVAGGTSSGNSVQLGTVSAAVSTSGTPGFVQIVTVNPNLSGNVTILDGQITGGSFTPGPNVQNGSISTGAISVPGGSAAVEAGHNLSIPSIDVTPSLPNSNGGTLVAISKSSTQMVVGAGGANSVGSIAGTNAVGNGSGGLLLLANIGSGGISVNNSTGHAQLTANGSGTSGFGGFVFVDSATQGGTGSLNFVNPVVQARGSNANGGQITVSSTGFITNNTFLSADASVASGSGDGGQVSISVSSNAADINSFGVGANLVGGNVSAGPGGGNGGTLTMSAGRDLNLILSAANSWNPAVDGNGGNLILTAGRNITTFNNVSTIVNGVGNGNGGTISMTAGGAVTLSGALNATGAGNGTGGQITLTGQTVNITQGIFANGGASGNGGIITINTNSIYPFTLSASGTPPNGTSSSISATGLNGGSVSIFNKGSGGITAAIQLINVLPVVNGNGGTIVLDAISNGGTGSVVLGSPSNGVQINTSGLVAGNGGSITIKGTSILVPSPSASVLFANGGPTGNGGSITLVSSDPGSDILIGNLAGSLDVFARGGTTSGNGGTFVITSGRNIITFSQVASYNAQPFNGSGGNYSFDAANNVQIFGGVNANAVGSGNGGSINIISHSTSPFLVNASGLNYVAGTLSANAATSGNGGTILVSNSGTGGITYSVAASDISATSAGNGNGGSVTLDAVAGGTGGTLTIGSGFTINASASGTGTLGGSITLKGNTLALGASGVNLIANGSTQGAGGIVYVQSTNASSDLTVGTNNIVISALGGTTSGAGGTVSVLAGRDLTVNTGSLSYLPTSGDGANLTFTAGRNLVVSSGLSGSAVGTGNGGSVFLTSNSSTVFTISSSTTNSINGVVSAMAATSGTEGSISIINLGSGGITSSGGISLLASGAGASGSSKLGTITLQGASISSLMTLQVNGGSTGDGGIINIISSSNASDVTMDAANLNLVASATNGSGGQINITSGRDMFFTPANVHATAAGTGNGGTYNLVAGRNLAINGSLDASGSTNGNGGSILIKMNSSAPFIIGQNSGNSVNGTLTANGSGVGDGGTVSITNLGSGGIADNVGANKISVQPGTQGNGGNITFDASKSGGTGPLYLGLPAVVFTLNASSSSGSGGTITLSGTDIFPSILGYNLTVASTAPGAGAPAGTISITTTTSTSDVRLGGAASLGADIHGTNGAGTLNITSGRDIIINGPTDGSGANGTNWFGPVNGNGATMNLTAGTKATAGNVIINPTLFLYALGTGNGGILNITFKDPTGQVNFGITGSGTSIGGGITATGSGGGAPGSITINNTAAGAGLNILMQGSGGISTSSVTASGFQLGTTNLVSNNGPVTVAVSAGLSTSFTVSGATSFNMSGTSGGLDFEYGNVQVNGPITITNNINAGSTIGLQSGSTFTSNNHDIQLTSQHININTTINSGGGNIVIFPRFLTNNGTVNAGGGTINVAPGGDLHMEGLGAWITSGANKFINFAAVNAALTFEGSQTYSDANGPNVVFGGLSVSSNPGTDQAVITNTTYDVGISYGVSGPVALNLSMGPYSRFNGAGLTTATMFIYSANSPGAANLNINVPDSTYATLNTNGGPMVIHTVIPPNTTGAVNFACPSCTAPGTLLFSKGNVTITSDDQITIGTNTILSSDSSITFNTPNMTLNGGITSSGSGNIVISSQTQNKPLTVSGTGFITESGSGTTALTSPDLLTLNGANIQFVGSTVTQINSPAIAVSATSTLTAGSGISFLNTGTLTQALPTLAGLTVGSATGSLVFNSNINASSITLSTANGTMSGTGTLNATGLLSLTGGTGDINLDTNVSSLTATSSGHIVVANVGALTINGITAGNVTVTGTTVTNSAAINVTSLGVSADTFNNNGTIIAATSVSVSSGNAGPLTIGGTGSISSGVANSFFANSGALTFAGSQTLTGITTLGALNFGQSVVINTGDTVSCNTDIYVNTPTLVLNGSLIGNAVHFNSVIGAGTIANNTGDITLPKTLTFSGQNLAILAAGNVIAPTGLSGIKLSSTTAKGGSLTVVAGYNFTPTASPQAPGLSNQFFILTGPSASGGSIIMPKTAIDTSTKAAGLAAGNVLLVASSGTTNSGVISVGGITTSAGTGVGGTVRIVAGGGAQVNGAILTKGGTAGAVTIIGAQPQIVGGQISFSNGLKFGSGTFTGQVTSGTGAGILVVGGITATATTGRGGDISLMSDAGIELDKGIVTSGISSPVANVNASGNVTINSLLSVLVGTGGINTSALAVTSGNAGNGGQVNVTGGSGISIKGNVLSTGGTTKAGGTGGKGGAIVFATSSNNPGSVFIGNTLISGYIDSRGGNSPTAGGGGGDITITSGTLQVTGAKSGISVNASGGTGGVTTNGNVALQTYSVQALPANFDMLSSTKSIIALPGGMFTIGTGSPINGTAGSVVSGSTSVASKASVNGGTGRIVSTNGVNLPKVSIGVVGGAVAIAGLTNPVAPDNGSGTRTLVTPAQAVALFQKSEGNTQTMNFNGNGQAVTGSSVTVDQVELPAAFTAFKLQAANSPNTDIHFLVTGLRPVVTLPKSNAVLGGEIKFLTAGSTDLVDFSGASITLLTGAAIRGTNTSTLILSGTGSTWTDNGTIEADKIEFARTATGALSFIVGSTGIIQAAAGAANAAIDLSPDLMSAYVVSFKSNGGQLNLPVEFGDVFAPAMYKSLALSNAANYNKLKPVTLTFALTGPGNVATTANLQGTALRTSTVAISALANKVGTTTTLTPLAIADGTHLTATTKLTIASVGGITIGNNVDLTAGVLKSTAPASGLIAATDIVTAGLLTITNTGSSGITVGNGGAFVVTGGNLAMTSSLGNISFGNGGEYQANGGRIQVLTLGQVLGGSTNDFYARAASSGAASAGGGIEIGSGVTIKTALLNSAFSLPKNTNPPSGVLGTGVVINNNGGVVLGNYSSGGLFSLTGSTLTLNKGVVVFDATGFGSTVVFTNSTFRTNALKPVAAQSVEHSEQDIIVDTQEDQSSEI